MVAAPAAFVVVGGIRRLSGIVRGEEKLPGDRLVNDALAGVGAGRQRLALVVHAVPQLDVGAGPAVGLRHQDAAAPAYR